MPSQRWQQLEEIFQTALDLSETDRSQFIQSACATDPELRREVETLLTQYEEAGDLLDQAAVDEIGIQDLASLIKAEPDPLIGQRLGAYRIEREIGSGGMGVVYVAERADDVFQRRVAIKVIRRGMDTDFILRRFRHERQILAALDHPNIARLLDGGATDTGLPYFVMEYIEGQPLYAYCDTRRLDLRERLRLFRQVCDAVNYAHQRRIIHRDIKPNNILVNAGGVPKLFDFGIAKLLNPDISSDTPPITATAMRMMTVEYASPEQIEGSAVTHLSDVYSLGVVLYELLTGHRPYRFRNRQPYEMARVICEEQPELPSTALKRTDNLVQVSHVDSNAVTIAHLCEMRQETLDGLRRELSGGLDDIALMALSKNPAERYQSAAELGEDVGRYLSGDPISARISARRSVAPSSTASSTAAAARTHPPEHRDLLEMQNRLQTSDRSVAVLPFKMLGARTGDTDEYLGVGLADALITRLSNVRRLLVRPTSSVLKYGEGIDPFDAGSQLAVSYIVDGNIRRAGETLRVTVQLLNVPERAVRWAGKFDEESTDVLRLEDLISEQVAGSLIPQLTQEEQRQLAKRGTEDPKAYAAYLRGRYFWNRFTPELLPKAIEGFQTAIAFDPTYALAYVGVADFYNWACIYGILPPGECYDLARAAAGRALALDDSLGEAHATMALLLEDSEWDFVEAERLYRRALELNPNYQLAHEWYSSLLVGTGRFAEGVREIRRAEELDPLAPRTMTLVAWTTYQAGEFAESLAKAEEIIELDPNYPQGYLQRGINLVQLGRAEEAVAEIQKAAELMAGSVLPNYELCFALVAANRTEEARAVLQQMLETAARAYVKPYWLAMAHAALDERDAAFAWFEKAFAEYDPWIIWFGTDPKLTPLHDDPRFVELFRRTGNPLSERP
ncbi:MAG TPA: protein kinase [Pyrinomonadaceae bacterium]|nr:protein kinase [Pyrinomonadaceae bacterium]